MLRPDDPALATWIAEHQWYLMVAMFTVMGAWETVAPLRELRLPTARRWIGHLILYLASTALAIALFRTGAVALAVAVNGNGPLGNPGIPFAIRCLAWILWNDLIGYGTHRLLHSVSLLWPVHRVHHSDRDMDFTSQFRFHPLETVLTRALEAGAILLLGPPPFAVALWGTSIIVSGPLSHSNVQPPARWDSWARSLFVTPGTHRRHHSLDPADQHSNFGILLTIWDRLFRTYREPSDGALVASGVDEISPPESLRVLHLLAGPFRSSRSGSR